MATEKDSPDESCEHEGSQILIDPLSEMLLLGTHIDYIKEDYSKQYI